MKKQKLLYLVIYSLTVLSFTNLNDTGNACKDNFSIRAIKNENGKWGIGVDRESGVSFQNLNPVQIELFIDHKRKSEAFGYDEVIESSGEFVGKANLRMFNGVILTVNDRWVTDKEFLHLKRSAKVSGDKTGDVGFMTGITFKSVQKFDRSEIGVFAPGMVYYGTKYIPDNAIGGSQVYKSGKGEVWIREDRLPAPLHGLHFRDGSSMAVLNPSPNGATSVEDARSKEIKPLIDKVFQFGSIGSKINDGMVEIGFWFPGSEGEMTYKADTYQEGRVHEWQLRYHPFEDGFTQNYQVDFRLGKGESFTEFYSKALRWAWKELDPEVKHCDLNQMRRIIIDMLAGQVITHNGRAGIPGAVNPLKGEPSGGDGEGVMGFVNRNLESANYFLWESLIDSGMRGDTLRKLGTQIVNSFIKLKMDPPVGVGYNIRTGKIADTHKWNKTIYSRSLGDGFYSLIRIIMREDKNGIKHPEWLAWAKSFADWLLTQQYPDGGFPRSWRPKTGEIVSASANSSYNPIPFLALFSKHTGEQKYLDAALKAGEFTWKEKQGEGKYFIGATLDNPDVIDAEAGALSLDAYLVLYEATKEQKWLNRAKQAGDFASSWIYIWNVPMVEYPDKDALYWDKDIPTTGVQLIAAGHSLVHHYMAFEADEFAKLYHYTGDDYYRKVAKILLHNTKSVIATPGKLYGFKGPGWQAEHWSIAPLRGYVGAIWWAWMPVSQLNGIFELMGFDSKLYEELAQ